MFGLIVMTGITVVGCIDRRLAKSSGARTGTARPRPQPVEHPPPSARAEF
ncbi:hypothetical protein [Cryobacterium sp. Hz9]|nr:hypothetical protein [Cryobacterium sp. Hz9]